MPLIKSSSRAAVAKNIRTEIRAGKPHRQAVAIALDTQRRAGGGKDRKAVARPGARMVKRGVAPKRAPRRR